MTATVQGTSRPAAWLVVFVVGMVAAAASAALPADAPARAVLALGAQAVTIVAAAWRFRVTPPRPALPWVVFIAGVVLSLVADLSGWLLGDSARWAADRPLIDLGYVVSYVLLASGIALAARSRGAGHDVGEIVDALIVTAAAGTAVFALVIGVHVETAPGTAVRIASLAVVVLGVVMLGLGSLVFIRAGRVSWAIGLLAGALVANLVSDTLYADGVLGEIALPRAAANMLVIVVSTCFAAALAHPAIVGLLQVQPGTAPLAARTRLVFITAAAVLAAIVGLAGQLFGEDDWVDLATDVLVLVIVALFAIRAWMLATEAGHAEAQLARAASALERSSALVAGISEAMPGALFAGDLATFSLDYASPGLGALLGVDPASALGKAGWILERLHPDDREEFVSLSAAARAAGRPSQSFENRMRKEDGGYRYVASTVRYLAGPSGKVDRFVGVGIDVTDRVEAEAASTASRALLEDVVRTTPALVIRGRYEPRVIDFAGPAIESMLGYRPEDVIGVEDWTIDHIHPDEVASTDTMLGDLLAIGGGVHTQTVRFRAADGSYRTLLMTIRVRVGGDGPPTYVASAIDVTEQREMEARLRERESFIADLVGTSPALILAGRADTDTIDFASPSVERILGFTADEVVGVPGMFQGLVHPDDSAFRLAQREATALAKRGEFGAVRRIRGKDGRYRALVIATRVMLDATGVARFVSSAMDISERIALEEELVAARDLAEQLVATTPGIILRARITPRIVEFASPGVELLLGYRPDEIVGVEDWMPAHFHPEDVAGQEDLMRGLLARQGGDATSTVRIRAADGSYVALLVTFRLRHTDDGTAEYFASAIDVTKQQEADAHLRERDAFIADVMQTSPAIIFAGRADTDSVDFVSSSIEQVLGYTVAEVVGVPGFIQDHVHPDDAAQWTAQRVSAVGTGSLDAGAVRRVRAKDGVYRSLVFATHVSTDASGTPRFVSSAMDISDRIALEEDLVAARDNADAASRAKTEFLSLVSHELRTPLTAVLGFGELLTRSDLPLQAREDAESIVEAGRRELRLVDRILDFVRLESGRLHPDMGPVIPSNIARQAIALVRAAKSEPVSIEDRTDPFADIVCSGDARRLVPIVEALLDNAIRHGGRDVTLTVSVEPTDEGGARIAVRDDGIGMTEEQIADAMAPLSRNGIGTGVALGLSLARRLVEAMGGDLEIISQPGAGTTVTVTLAPCAEEATTTGTRPVPAPRSPAGGDEGAAGMSPVAGVRRPGDGRLA